MCSVQVSVKIMNQESIFEVFDWFDFHVFMAFICNPNTKMYSDSLDQNTSNPNPALQ